MNIDHLREAFSPWIDVVICDFSKNFLFDYGIDTLALLHEKIDSEIENVYSTRIKDKKCIKKAEELFNALTYLYNHFCWKMSHQKDSPNVTKSCVKLLSQLIKTGLILSKGLPQSEWINRLLTAISLFKGAPELIYEAILLVSCLKSKYHRAYIVILKHVLINEDQECITDPLVYMEVILLFRRLKGLLRKNYTRACAITLAARIKPPCNLISWLMSLDVKDVNGLKYKTIAKQLMKNKVPETLLKKVRDIALSSYVFKSDINTEKDQDVSNEPSDLFVIDVSSVNNPSRTNPQKRLSNDKYESANMCIPSERRPKEVSHTSSSKKKKKKKQLALSQNQIDDKHVKSKESAPKETVFPVASAIESEDYYMASQSDMSVNAASLKDTCTKSNKATKAPKRKQKSKVSHKNFIPNADIHNKEQEIEIIEISDSDNEPHQDLTHTSEITKATKRKSSENLQSTNIASETKKKMIQSADSEIFHSSLVDQSNLGNHKISKDTVLPRIPYSSNYNSNLQFSKNSKPSEKVICKMPSKENANKTMRLTENTNELSVDHQHMTSVSSTEPVADSCTHMKMPDNSEEPKQEFPSILHVPKKEKSTSNVSNTKLLIESNSQIMSMEVDTEETTGKDICYSKTASHSEVAKNSEMVSEDEENKNFICKDSDNHLLLPKYPHKEAIISQTDVENSKESVNPDVKLSELSSDCVNLDKIHIKTSPKLSESISNSNYSEAASVNSYNSFVQFNVKNKQTDNLEPHNTPIKIPDYDKKRTLKNFESLSEIEGESVGCEIIDNSDNLQSKYSLSNIQSFDNNLGNKIYEESQMYSNRTSPCLDTSEAPKTPNHVPSPEKNVRKRKLSDISKSDDASEPANCDSVELDLNKSSDKFTHLQKEFAQNNQSQTEYTEISNVSLEAQCVEVDIAQGILENISIAKHQHDKLTSIVDDVSNNKLDKSLKADSPTFSQKLDHTEPNSTQNESSNDSKNLESENFQISNAMTNTSPQSCSGKDVAKEISISSDNANKYYSTVFSNSFSEDNSKIPSPAVFQNESKMCSDASNSDDISSQNSSNLVEIESKEKTSLESVKNISDTMSNTSLQSGSRKDVAKKISISPDNASKHSSTVFSCSFSENNLKISSPVFQNESKMCSEAFNSDDISSQNGSVLVEIESKETTLLESVKNTSSPELNSSILDSQSKISDQICSNDRVYSDDRVPEEKNVPSKSSHEFSNTCNSNFNAPEKILDHISAGEQPENQFPNISNTDAAIQENQESEVTDAVKGMHLVETFSEEKFSNKNTKLKSQISNTSLEDAEQIKISEEINLSCNSSHKSSIIPHLNTDEETQKNVSCSFEEKNLKRELSDISDSNEMPVLKTCDHAGNDSFEDSSKINQTEQVRIKPKMEDVESEFIESNASNSTLKNGDTMSKILGSPTDSTVKCSTSYSDYIACETAEPVSIVEKYQQEKLDVLNSNVKSQNCNASKSKSFSSNIGNNSTEHSPNLTQNISHCETEIKIKTDFSSNNENVAEELAKSSPLVEASNNLNNFTEISDNFRTIAPKNCSTSAVSAKGENMESSVVVLLMNTNVTTESNNTEAEKSVKCVEQISSDEISKDYSDQSDMNKVHDLKDGTAIESGIPNRQSKLIIYSSDDAKFPANNCDIETSSLVTDSESKFSSKCSSSESIDVLHNSDEEEHCKESIVNKDSNIQNISTEAHQEPVENETKILKHVESEQDDCSKISDKSSASKEISKSSQSENFLYTCENKDYLSFSDISLRNKGLNLVDNCSESSHKLKNFSYAASTEIFSSYRNDLLSEEDKTSVLSCGPELKDCGSCKSQELSDEENSNKSVDNCYSDHSNSDIDSSQMREEVDIAPVETVCTKVISKTDGEGCCSKKEITVDIDETSYDEKNNVTVDTDLSQNESSEKNTLSEELSQKTESMPRHSLRLINKSKSENAVQCDSPESASHKKEDFPDQEIDYDNSKQTIDKDSLVFDYEKDMSSLNEDEVPPSPKNNTNKNSSAKQKGQSKSKSKESTEVCTPASSRYSLRRKSRRRDDSSKLGIDISQLNLGSPSSRRTPKVNPVIAKLLPLDSDPSEKVDDESDLALYAKPETRSSVAKALKEEALNTPSYNLRLRKSIINPEKLKI